MLLASFSVLLVALIAFQLEFSHATTQYLSAVNEKFVKNAAESITYKTEAALSDVLTAYSSHYGMSLMAASEPSAVNMVLAMGELDNKISQNKTLHSVYFYNSITQRISAFGATRSYLTLPEFRIVVGDMDIVPRLEQQAWTEPVARMLTAPYNSNKQDRVFTIVYWTPAGNGRRNAIVVNLLADEVFGMLKNSDTAYSEAQNNFLVYDKSGQLLFNGLVHPQLLEAGTQALTEIIQSESAHEVYRKGLDGETFLFHPYRTSGGQMIVNIVNKNDLAKSFSYSPIFFTAVLCAACILGVGTTLLFSMRLYLPIGTLTKKLVQTAQVSDENARSEIDFIHNSIQSAAQKLDHLFAYKEKTLSFSQVHFLQTQLLTNRYTAGEFWQECKAKELPCAPGDSFLLVDISWCTAENANDARVISYAVANVLHELLDAQMTLQQVPLGENETLFVCLLAQDAPLAVEAPLATLRGIFAEHFSVALCTCVSAPAADPEQLCETRAALQELAVYRWFLPDGGLLTAQSMAIDTRLTELCPLPDFDAIETALRTGDEAACEALMNAYWNDLSQHTYEAAIASVSLLAARFVSCCRRVESQLLASFEIDYHSLYKRLSGAQQLSVCRAIVSETAQLVCAYVSADGNDAMLSLAGKIAEGIDASYQDFNLSSKSLAVRYHLSVTKLNHIFKRKTGDTVANYIKLLRLTKAKDLLSKTNLPVETIAWDVGFENTKYFYTLFKTEYGVSPTHYRITSSAKTE